MVTQPDKNDFKVTEMPVNPIGNAVYYLKTDGDNFVRIRVTDADGVAYPVEKGDSAYAVAVTNGFVGTEAEWLASLTGPSGADGDVTTAALNAAIDASEADLASTSDAAKGTALVGYLSSTAGAVGQTISAFLSKQEINAGLFDIDWTGASASNTGFQAAITAAAGKTLRLLPGIILLTGTTAAAAVTLPAAGIRIQGAGKYVTTIKMANTTAAAMIVGIDTDKFEIDGVGFDGQATARVAWQRAMVLRGVQDSQITNCRFYRIGDGGVLYGMQGFGGSDAYGEGTRQPKRVRVTHCDFENCYSTVALLSKYTGIEDFQVSENRFRNACSIAISVESQSGGANVSRRTVVSNNVIYGCSYLYTSGLSAVAYGISLGELVENVVCNGNIIDTVTGDTLAVGILVSTSPSQTDTLTQRMIVAANTICNVTGASGRGHGVLVQAGDTSVTEVSVNGNIIWDCEDGITVEPDSTANTLGYVRGITITDNIITDCTEFGIWFNSLSSSGSLALVDSIISNNIVRGSTSHGINLKSVNCNYVGNIVTGNGGAGFAIASGSSRNVLLANRVYANGTDGFSVYGDDTHLIGNVARNNGTAGGTNYGIYCISGARIEIIGNDCGDDAGSPTQDYGIRAVAGSTVRNNKLIGNSAGTVWGGIGLHNTGTYDAGLNRTA